MQKNVKALMRYNEDVSYYDRIIRQDVFRLEKHPIPKNHSVLDIGAHIGLFSIRACLQYGCYAYAFEPCTENYECLLTNVELNSLDNLVDAWQRGLWEADGKMKLYRDPVPWSYDSHTCVPNDQKTEDITVLGVESMLDMVKHPIHYLKCNCEGGERWLMERMVKDPMVLRVPVVSIEIHPDLTGEEIFELAKKIIYDRTKLHNLPTEIRVAKMQVQHNTL